MQRNDGVPVCPSCGASRIIEFIDGLTYLTCRVCKVAVETGVIDPPLNYIDEIAIAIYQFDGAKGFPNQIDFLLYRIYAVLALAKGENTTLKDVHDAWSAWSAETFSIHRSLVPFDELAPEVQALDQPYCDAIRAVSVQIADDLDAIPAAPTGEE